MIDLANDGGGNNIEINLDAVVNAITTPNIQTPIRETETDCFKNDLNGFDNNCICSPSGLIIGLRTEGVLSLTDSAGGTEFGIGSSTDFGSGSSTDFGSGSSAGFGSGSSTGSGSSFGFGGITIRIPQQTDIEVTYNEEETKCIRTYYLLD